MTKTGFIIANLFRKKTRTILTLLSVMCAFLLFGLLQAVNVLLKADVELRRRDAPDHAGAGFVHAAAADAPDAADRSRARRASASPIRCGSAAWSARTRRYSRLPSIRRAHCRRVSPQWVMPEDQWSAFATTRTGMIAGQAARRPAGLEDRQQDSDQVEHLSAAQRQQGLGVRPGRHLRRQGRGVRRSRRCAPTSTMPISTRPTSSATAMRGFFILRLADPQPGRNASRRTVDAMFENSPDETKTQTEQDFIIGFVKQIGDIGLIVRWILFAVFFTLLLVVGNTMAQACASAFRNWPCSRPWVFPTAACSDSCWPKRSCSACRRVIGGPGPDASWWRSRPCLARLPRREGHGRPDSRPVGLLPALRTRGRSRLATILVMSLAGKNRSSRRIRCLDCQLKIKMDSRAQEDRRCRLAGRYRSGPHHVQSDGSNHEHSISRAFPSGGALPWSSSSALPASSPYSPPCWRWQVGFETTLKSTGRTDVAMIMRGGSEAELNSVCHATRAYLDQAGAGCAQATTMASRWPRRK